MSFLGSVLFLLYVHTTNANLSMNNIPKFLPLTTRSTPKNPVLQQIGRYFVGTPTFSSQPQTNPLNTDQSVENSTFRFPFAFKFHSFPATSVIGDRPIPSSLAMPPPVFSFAPPASLQKPPMSFRITPNSPTSLPNTPQNPFPVLKPIISSNSTPSQLVPVPASMLVPPAPPAKPATAPIVIPFLPNPSSLSHGSSAPFRSQSLPMSAPGPVPPPNKTPLSLPPVMATGSIPIRGAVMGSIPFLPPPSRPAMPLIPHRPVPVSSLVPPPLPAPLPALRTQLSSLSAPVFTPPFSGSSIPFLPPTAPLPGRYPPVYLGDAPRLSVGPLPPLQSNPPPPPLVFSKPQGFLTTVNTKPFSPPLLPPNTFPVSPSANGVFTPVKQQPFQMPQSFSIPNLPFLPPSSSSNFPQIPRPVGPYSKLSVNPQSFPQTNTILDPTSKFNKEKNVNPFKFTNFAAPYYTQNLDFTKLSSIFPKIFPQVIEYEPSLKWLNNLENKNNNVKDEY